MYVGDPPQRQDVPVGGLIHVEPGRPLQTANHGDEDLVVYAYGTPPEREHAEILDSALARRASAGWSSTAWSQSDEICSSSAGELVCVLLCGMSRTGWQPSMPCRRSSLMSHY
jgi:hypothetical protein